jgi:hypothetical protein
MCQTSKKCKDLILQDAFFFIQHKVRDRKRKHLHMCINLVISVANTYNFIDINSHSWKFWLFWSMISHRIGIPFIVRGQVSLFTTVRVVWAWMFLSLFVKTSVWSYLVASNWKNIYHYGFCSKNIPWIVLHDTPSTSSCYQFE